jgi:hypothetical protein
LGGSVPRQLQRFASRTTLSGMTRLTLFRRSRRPLGLLFGLLLSGCGGQKAGLPASPARAAPGTASADTARLAEPQPSAQRGEAATADAEADATQAVPPGPADDAPREILFLIKPDGLQVDIEGARFRPHAKAIRVGGGWGVEVNVDAVSHDDRTHSLLRADTGVLAFAGLTRRGGEEARFADTREGGEEQLLFPDGPLTLSRNWPGTSGQAALRRGDELVLEVGLWGLGDTAAQRRPVKKFFLVQMKVTDKPPRPVVTPPVNR